MSRTEKNTAGIAGFLLPGTLILLAAAVAVCWMAGNGELLAREMLRCAPPETTGLSGEKYPEMGRMIADYLTGRRPDFQFYVANGGNMYALFQPHEMNHMRDCRELIYLAETLRWILGAAVLVMIGTGVFLRKYRGRFSAGMRAGLFLAVAAGLLITVWAIVDFGGFFTAFHRFFFTNDGWLLNPQTDLLIRLMPTPFFVGMGTRLLAAVAAAALGAFTAAEMIRRCGRKENA